MQKRRLLVLALTLSGSPWFAYGYDCSYSLIVPPSYGASVPQQENLVVQGDGSIEVSCDPNVNLTNPLPLNGMVTVTLTATPGAGSYMERRLGAGGPTYNLYVNSSHSSIWGDGTAGTAVFTHTFRFSPTATVGAAPTVNFGPEQRFTFPVYSAVRSSLNIRPRGYVDTVVTTMTY